METARLPEAHIEVVEDVGIGRGNRIANLAVVGDPFVPRNGRARRRGCLGEFGDDL